MSAEYILGFKAFHDANSDLVGDARTNEGWAPDHVTGATIAAVQRSENGWLLWDPALNRVDFFAVPSPVPDPPPPPPGPTPQGGGMRLAILENLAPGTMQALQTVAPTTVGVDITSPHGVDAILAALAGARGRVTFRVDRNGPVFAHPLVTAYTLWNEPNPTRDGADPLAAAAKMQALADRIRAVAPHAIIGGPDIGVRELQTDWGKALTLAVAQYVDELRVHAIPPTGSAAEILALATPIPALLRSWGIDKPIILGEFGCGADGATQAAFLEAVVPGLAAAGFAGATVSMLCEKTTSDQYAHFGLFSVSGQPKAGWDAMKALAAVTA